MNPVRLMVTVAATALLAAGSAMAQPSVGMTFSADFQGPTVMGPGPFTGIPDFFAGIPIDEGAILTPGLPGPPGPNPPSLGPLPPPGVMVTPVPGGPGTVPGGLGILPGAMGGVELDALSYGRDLGEQFFFSVDEFAMGIPASPAPPNVFTEGSAGPAFEASADIFMYLGPAGPVAPGLIFGNTGIVDGDGLVSATGFVYPGVGLIEANPPTPEALPDPGDNLDAVDIDTTLGDVMGLIYFSLDSAFPDPLEAAPANTGTAAGNGFVGGDVLVSSAGGIPAVYAAAILLGLDLVGGPDSDDLDALALWENGDGIYTPGVDLLFFSVRRGSAVIGAPDSIWGVPIEEGDILIPIPGALPGIFIPGEALGLMTMRMGGGQFGADDLDALDVVPEPATLLLLGLGGLALLRRRR